MTTLPPPCANCHEIWEPQPPGALRACPGIALSFTHLPDKGARHLRMTTLPPSCADCQEIWEPQPPGALWACPGIALSFTHLPDQGARHLRMTTLPPSCADYQELWEPQPPGALRACPGLYRDCSTVYLFTWHHNVISQKTSPIQLLNY
jgi:hypothetical protein